MIIYQKTANEFRHDVDSNRVSDEIKKGFLKNGLPFPKREIGSWDNSLRAMESVVRNSRIKSDCGVLIEYRIPPTSRRIDFVVTGEGEDSSKNFVIVELKQWQEANSTSKEGIVHTSYHGDELHPSYQAQSYKILVREYNENVHEKNIKLSSCAYLHNYIEKDPEPLKAKLYAQLVKDTQLYFKHDKKKLQEFLFHHVGKGKGMGILDDIQNSKTRPSKKLIDHVGGMYKGNPAYTLIDNQKVAYEKALELARNADEKTVLVVKGGPGTGKSVVSVSLLVGLLADGRNTVFVAPNAAFRDVMVARLARDERRMILNNLFKGSASFHDVEENTYDVAVVDEAHRLKDGSAYQYRGESQVRDILRAARCVVLFIDDDQRVRPHDIGSVACIKSEARTLGARVFEIELEAQFRCSGADGYINWLDHVLHIRETANYDGWGDSEFDFQIFDDPNELKRAIESRRSAGYDSRILAGYAWPWTNEGNSDGQVKDVRIDEFGFAMPWNSRASRTTWAIDEQGNDQVGCIHTAQGLEFDYVGVLVGDELRFDEAKNEFFVDWSSYKDSSGKTNLRNDPEKLSLLVRNIYKVLMSRGMKGCYVYFVNKSIEAHFRDRLPLHSAIDQDSMEPTSAEGIIPFKNALPIIPLRSVATAAFQSLSGYLPLDSDEYDEFHYVSNGPFPRDRFLVRVEGNSMEPKIPAGSLCRFRLDPGGTRNNRIVLCLVEEYAGDAPVALIKRYRSVREETPDELGEASSIILDSINPEHGEIVFTNQESVRILGVFEKVVDE